MEKLACPICGQRIVAVEWAIRIHRDAHANDKQVAREELRVGDFEDRLGCPYCRDQDKLPGSVLDVQWRIHNDKHVVDKLEPAWPEPDPWPRDVNTTPSFEETFRDIFREAFDLLVERQKKYGPENIRSLGLWGTFDRLASDKIERVRRAFNGKLENGTLVTWLSEDFTDESFEDALLDIANYALIMLSLKRGVWGRPLEGELDAD